MSNTFMVVAKKRTEGENEESMVTVFVDFGCGSGIEGNTNGTMTKVKTGVDNERIVVFPKEIGNNFGLCYASKKKLPSHKTVTTVFVEKIEGIFLEETNQQYKTMNEQQLVIT